MEGQQPRLRARLRSWIVQRAASKRVRIGVAVFVLLTPIAMLGVNRLTASAAPCPCNVFSTNPSTSTFNQPGGIEVGFKFRSSVSGYISGIRFYKTSGMAGTHTASLWNNNGTSRLAQATFTSESGSGWQQVNFTPVAISANTIYTASVFMADGNYTATAGFFNSHDEINGVLTAPRNGQAFDGNGIGENGVYNASGSSAYPTSFFNGGNYWVDVAFSGSPDGNPPTVSSTVPTASATGVNVGQTVSATFNSVMDSATISTSTFQVKDDQSNPVTGTVSYNATSRTASFAATEALATNKTYTATLEGGTGTVVKNIDDQALASDYNWTFTTASTDPCPCSLQNKSAPTGSATTTDTGTIELGVKVVPQANGYITALRFYKPILSTETTHTGNVWDGTGAKVATATFSNETEYGWQEAKLASPLRVNQGQLYVVSYGSSQVIYQATVGGLNADMTSGSLTAYANNDARNATTGSGNRNGVFTATAGNYPGTGSTTGNYYWVDAVFSTTSTVSDPLSVALTQPKNSAYGVPATQVASATFNRALNAATITGSTVQMLDANNNAVTGTAAYDATEHKVTFTPSSNLGAGQKYTVKLAASIADTNGATLGSEYSWSFTVGSALNTDLTSLNNGTGGPILVVTSSGSATSPYYAEILRSEGLNYFDAKDITQVSASTLNGYDAVVLSEMSLTQPQADMFNDWVTAGGNLVAMRPDKKLASLLGLTDASSTRTNQYYTVDTNAAPGQGIVSESMQFKGTADNYTLSGATAVATLYSNASTSTTNPATTMRSVGSNGGTAMAFTYDLAKSVIALHQGNQAWAGDERDGVLGIRPNDLFYGAKSGDVQADWVDMNKVQIPQADEAQRLLANMLTHATKDKKPLPRLWYLPNGSKAALVFSGDDHVEPQVSGTERTFSDWLNESNPSCSVMDWECVRASNYIYTNTPLSNARAVQYHDLGFEIGDHPSNAQSCASFGTYNNLLSLFTADLTAFRNKYTGLPNQKTDRFHCYLWSDWDSMARATATNGMRYSLDYVAYPQAWINGKSPMLTGSGMNMRFTNSAGAMLDIRQGVTNFDNVAANSTSINAMFDNAVGGTGYYGIFGSHYDMTDNYDRTLLAAARSRNIPTITSLQALTWLDGRDNSAFSGLTGSNGQYSFTLTAGQGATGLKAMMPVNDAGGTITDIKKGADVVTYQTQTVKGVQYAVFDGAPGDYTASYSDHVTPPDPDPDPGDSGSTGSSGSSSSGSSSAGRRNLFTRNTTPDLTTITAPTAEQKEEQQDATTPTTTGQQSDTAGPEKEFIQQEKETKSNTVAWVLVGATTTAALGGGLWWLLMARRRHRADQQWQ